MLKLRQVYVETSEKNDLKAHPSKFDENYKKI